MSCLFNRPDLCQTSQITCIGCASARTQQSKVVLESKFKRLVRKVLDMVAWFIYA